jgi:hypothetical protein
MDVKVSVRVSCSGTVLREETISHPKVLLGRACKNDPARIVLEDETVSFDHAQIQIRGEDVLIQDLKSRNRVLINGKFINPGVFYRLRHGDVIEICAFELQVSIKKAVSAPPQIDLPERTGDFGLARLSAPASMTPHDFATCQTLPGNRLGLAVGCIEHRDEIREETGIETGDILRTVAAGGGAPSAVIEGLNGIVLTDLATENPIAVSYGIFDPAKASFRVASAGSITPVFFNRGRPQVLRRIPSGAGPLNVTKKIEGLSDKLIRFRPGDVLLLMTQGLLDASFVPDHQETQDLRNLVREELIDAWGEKLSAFIERLKARVTEVESKVGDFGLQGVSAVVARTTQGGPQGLVNGLQNALKEHLRGQTPSLDQTVLCMEKLR